MARSRSGTGTLTAAPVRSDAYTGLLVIALIAQIVAALFFFLDWSQYPDQSPKEPPAAAAPAGPAPAGPAGPAPAGPAARSSDPRGDKVNERIRLTLSPGRGPAHDESSIHRPSPAAAPTR